MSVPPVLPSARRAGRLLALPAVAAALAVASAAPAHAASASCPTPPERLKLTWGVSGPDADIRTTTGRWPTAFRSSVEPGVARSGLGLGVDPEIRTVRTTRGVGRPVLCAGGKVRARLPELPRGTVVGGASANGSWVAWRTAKRGALGRVHVGQVVGGRLRAVRYRETVRGVAHEIVNGNIVVTASGAVAWTVGPGPRTRVAHSVGAVWPRGGEAAQVPVPDRPEAGGGGSTPGRPIFVLNDHQVQVDDRGATPFAFRAPTAGTCPPIIDGRTVPFAGWRLSLTLQSRLSFAPKSLSTSRAYVVCDPASGRTLTLGTANSAYGVGGHDGVRTMVRSGERLFVAREAIGPADYTRKDEVAMVDAATGASETVAGWLAAPGVTAPPKALLGDDPAVTGPGVAVAPGVTAWIRGSDATPTATVVVRDAGGTRSVAAGASITGLRLDGDRVRWSTDGVPGEAPVVPAAGEPVVFGPAIDAFTELP